MKIEIPTTLRKWGKSGLALLFACAVIINSAAVATASDAINAEFDPADEPGYEDLYSETDPEAADPEGDGDLSGPADAAAGDRAGTGIGDPASVVGSIEADTGIRAEDVTVALGDEDFGLLDGVEAFDADGAPIAWITVADDGGFDVFVSGDYRVTYTAVDPATEAVYEAVRRVTVEEAAVAAAGFVLPGGTDIGVSSLDALRDAIANAPQGTPYVIAVESDITLDGAITVVANTDIHLVSADSSGGATLYAAGGERHFVVSDGADLTLADLVLNGGGVGGGIANAGVLYLLEGGIVTNGLSDGRGGGIYNTGTVYMEEGSAVTNNVSGLYDNEAGSHDSAGGGIYNDEGDLVMRGGSILGNRTHSDANRSYGGGVNVYRGTFEMTGGTIEGNTAHSPANKSGATYGGGVYVDTGATLLIDGGQILGNLAAGASSNYGGGVAVAANATLTLKKGTISGNYTVDSAGWAYGGGVYVAANATFTMDSGNVSSNKAQAVNYNYGGGVYLATGGNLHLSGGEIEANEANLGATSLGGGVYMSAGSSANNKVTSFTMNGGAVSGNVSKQGGGVYMSGTASEYTVFTMQKGTISGNAAETGGGVYMKTGTFTMSGGSVANNEAVTGLSSSGGGVYMTSGQFTLHSGDIKANRSTAGGGGVSVRGGQFDMADGFIADNRSAQGSGGGVDVYGGAFTMQSGEITGNYSGSNGGGIHVSDAAATVVDGLISGNTAEWSGGGIHTDHADSVLEIRGGTISYNRSNGAANAGHGGGGVSATTVNLIVSGGDFIGNEATGYGGGLRIEYLKTGTVSISGATFTGNRAQSGGGISVFNDISKADIANCVITDNRADEYGGGIYAYYWDNVGVKQATFSGNTAGYGAYAFDMGKASILQTYNDQIKSPVSLSLPFDIASGDETMNKAYNNYDINYTRGTHLGYTVTYRANGAEGTPPVDPKTYGDGEEVTVLGGEGLTLSGYQFLGWSTDPDATAAQYGVGDTFTIQSSTILYAVFARSTTPLQFYVTYNGNGHTDGTPPVDGTAYNRNDSVTVLGQGSLERNGYSFLGWSERSSATEAQYTAGNTFDITGNTALYAVWQKDGGGSPGPGPGTSYRVIVEHYLYEADEAPADAIRQDAHTFDDYFDAGTYFEAETLTFPNYTFQESVSDARIINSLSRNTTIKLYYQRTGRYIGFGELTTETAIEVLDRRSADAQPMSWSEFVAYTGLMLYVDDEPVASAVLTSVDYLSIDDGGAVDFGTITTNPVTNQDVPYRLTVVAQWRDSTGGDQTTEGDITLRIVDTTPPDIAVGSNRVVYRPGSGPANEAELLSYVRIAVSDNYDSAVPFVLSYHDAQVNPITYAGIDWSAVGEYGFYIDATDASGNRATREAVIIAITNDGDNNGGDNGGGGTERPRPGGSTGGGDYIGDNPIPYTQLDDGSWIADGDIPLEELPFTGSAHAVSWGLVPALFVAGGVVLHQGLTRRRQIH